MNACKKFVPESTPSIIDGFILNKCMPIDFIKIVSKPINVSLGILEKCGRMKSRFRSNNTESEMNTRMITAGYTVMRRDPLNNIWVVTQYRWSIMVPSASSSEYLLVIKSTYWVRFNGSNDSERRLKSLVSASENLPDGCTYGISILKSPTSNTAKCELACSRTFSTHSFKSSKKARLGFLWL